MKTHLELYGWEIRRIDTPKHWGKYWGPPNWFELILPGSIGAYAGGPLPFIAKVLRKHFEGK